MNGKTIGEWAEQIGFWRHDTGTWGEHREKEHLVEQAVNEAKKLFEFVSSLIEKKC